MLTLNSVRQIIKRKDSKITKIIYFIYKFINNFSLPSIKTIHLNLYKLHITTIALISKLLNIIYYKPVFKSYLNSYGNNLMVSNSIPYITGNLKINVGNNFYIDEKTNLQSRYESNKCTLNIGDNVTINKGTIISVADDITIGNNVYISKDCYICAYPGHPIDAQARRENKPDTDDLIGNIAIEDNVYIEHKVIILKNVTIGENSVIKAGSVVTKNVEKNSIIEGNPAKTVANNKVKQYET